MLIQKLTFFSCPRNYYNDNKPDSCGRLIKYQQNYAFYLARYFYLISNSVVHHSLFFQLQVLSNIRRQGPTALLEPNDLFNLCLYSSLMPKSVQTGLSCTSPVSSLALLFQMKYLSKRNLQNFLFKNQGCHRKGIFLNLINKKCNVDVSVPVHFFMKFHIWH